MLMHPGMSLCEVRCCWTAAVGLACVLRGCCSNLLGSVASRPDCVQDGTHTNSTDTHTQNTVRGCREENTLKCSCCCIMASTTYKELGGRGRYTAVVLVPLLPQRINSLEDGVI